MLTWFAKNAISPDRLQLISKHIDWVRILPFVLLNLSCLCVYWVGFSWTAFFIALFLCYLRIFSIGAFYHRYFSHRAFKTNRVWQFIFAILAGSAVQRGPLWWASNHRQHHAVSDLPDDIHSPVQHGFWWSHMGWFLSKRGYFYNPNNVKDLLKYPELAFLDKHDWMVPVLFAVCIFGLGVALQHLAPSLGTNGWQLLVWGFSISTVVVFHITVSINSLAHQFGKKEFNTKDNSRNNWLLALLTFGEGWHNNHHHYPSSAKQGFKLWQIDITYYLLLGLQALGIIWDLRSVPEEVLANNLVQNEKTVIPEY
jgi:stearoyl-CoA desaturase (Delta-9 desaturase)